MSEAPFLLVVRVFVEASPDRLQGIADRLTARFAAPASELRIEPYPKFEGCFLISFCLPGHGDPNQALRQACETLGRGWHYRLGSEPGSLTGSANWTPGPEASFVQDTVQFANLLVSPPEITDDEDAYEELDAFVAAEPDDDEF